MDRYDEVGPDQLVFGLPIDMGQEAAMETIALFGEHVIPKLRPRPGAPLDAPPRGCGQRERRLAGVAAPAPVPVDADRPIKGQLGAFEWEGHRLVYEVRGPASSGRTIVLLHGLLLPSWVNGDMASRLADRGYRVVLFDLLGHGRSDKPYHASAHRMEFAGEQVVALLDHLGIRRAVVGGMSLGANVSLQVATTAPERVQALICEMPVLERGAIPVMLTLFPLLLALRYGGPVVRGLFRLVKQLPRTGNEPLDAILDTGDDPRAMAAVMHGYTSGPVCPPRRDRERITVPALVIAHGRDWMHPMDDAKALAEELPDATFLEARSMLELRTSPDRLVEAIAGFLDGVWAEAARR